MGLESVVVEDAGLIDREKVGFFGFTLNFNFLPNFNLLLYLRHALYYCAYFVIQMDVIIEIQIIIEAFQEMNYKFILG